MEELKFRVFDPIKKKMHYNALPYWMGDVIYLEKGEEKRLEPWADKEPILMQYIGMKDKNGKEIYEGDIIKTNRGLSIVQYEEYGYLPFMDQVINCSDAFYCWNFAWYLVVGNIYENPELLDITNCDG